jgi:hypothetical protein
MSIPKAIVVFLLLIACATLLDFLLAAPHVPFHAGGRYGGGIGEFMIEFQILVLAILIIAIRAFQPRQKEWLVGSVAALIVLALLWLNGSIFTCI